MYSISLNTEILVSATGTPNKCMQTDLASRAAPDVALRSTKRPDAAVSVLKENIWLIHYETNS